MRLSPRALLLLAVLPVFHSMGADVVLPELAPNLINHYDFEHPVEGNAAKEQDRGLSGTAIDLVNGGAAMRVSDGAWSGSTQALQTQQVIPAASGNDDWKAGLYNASGVASLSAYNGVAGITLMGWVKPTGTNPSPNYNAVGLFGILSGTSEGHAVRALLEVINVNGTLQLVALGRRPDAGNSYTLAATADWHSLLPDNTWTHLAATFDFDKGTMALYRNGQPVDATYTATGDPWSIVGAPEPDLSSPTNPAGIKIGGSFPQDTEDRNPFNGRFDELMFFNKQLSAEDVQKQYENFAAVPEPTAGALFFGGAVFVILLRRRLSS